MIALLGYPAVKFFVRHEPFGADLSDDLSSWLMYLVLIALVIGFTRRFRLDHEELVIVSRERQRSEQRLYHQANFDALTGIANRMLFFDRLTMTLEHVTRHGSTLAILFIDIDGFKDVNDTYGHVAGDQLLTQIAGALKESVRAEDTVARLGGDEFAILVPRLDKSRDMTHLASKVLKAIAQPFQVEGGQVAVSASVGVALSSDSGNDSARLVRCADMAMFHAKKHGKNGYHVFERQMLAERERYHHMQRRLKEALSRKEFVLHYQPKRQFQSQKLTGVEALIRWKPPEGRGLVMPNDFIWILEESGLIEGVGRVGGARSVRANRRLAVPGLEYPGGGQCLGEADWSGVRAAGEPCARGRHRRWQHARARDHGVRGHAASGGCDSRARRAPRDGSEGHRRRLRHRPLKPVADEAPAAGRPQDRPLVRLRTTPQRGRCLDL